MMPRVLGSLQVCQARVGGTQCLGFGKVVQGKLGQWLAMASFSLVFLYVGPKFFQGKLPLCSWNLANNKVKANIANAMAAKAQVQHMEDVEAQGVDGHTRGFENRVCWVSLPEFLKFSTWHC